MIGVNIINLVTCPNVQKMFGNWVRGYGRLFLGEQIFKTVPGIKLTYSK